MATTQFFILGMGFLDTAMSGHYSANDLAGVSLAGNVIWPVFMLIAGINMALVPIVSQLRGAGRLTEVGAMVNKDSGTRSLPRSSRFYLYSIRNHCLTLRTLIRSSRK
ncbi:MAG: hypothetical protein CM1200mP24_06330 [Gammaproteobacteria bacterium]|nr:MAG: hypothetical protein CM1200mP24_06330 [Gammaproteobacteria bacterium]